MPLDNRTLRPPRGVQSRHWFADEQGLYCRGSQIGVALPPRPFGLHTRRSAAKTPPYRLAPIDSRAASKWSFVITTSSTWSFAASPSYRPATVMIADSAASRQIEVSSAPE